MLSKTFDQPGEHAALRAAEAWLKERGFSYGSHQRGAPTGVLHGNIKISKWRNLDTEERNDLHGMIEAPKSLRHGPIVVKLREDVPSEVKHAFLAPPPEETARPGPSESSLLGSGAKGSNVEPVELEPVGDGGPAFPVKTSTQHAKGMSLRDYFAIHASESDIRAIQDHEDQARLVPTSVLRYRFADTMLAERAKRGAS